MTRQCAAALVFLLGSLAVAPLARAQSNAPDVFYSLAGPPSQFEWGCFGPCACPVLIQSPLQGTFVLHPSHSDANFTYYDVLDVKWDAPGDGTNPVRITGAGTYRRGGEVALTEQMVLDLSFDGGPLQHFDTGLKPPGAAFPEIKTRLSLHQEFCHDSVLAIDAKPSTVLDAGGANPPLAVRVTPNPFRTGTEMRLDLPRDGVVALGIFEITGRRVRTLIDRQWLPAGRAVRAWDGRRDDGRPAPAGLYLVRFETPAGSITHTLAKLE